MKTKLLTALLIGSSVFTSASSFATYSNPGHIELGLTGGGFRSMNENNPYGILANAVANPPSGTALDADSSHEFGGAVSLGYRFAESPYTLGIVYWGADNDKTKSASGIIGLTKAPANFSIDFAQDANSRLDYKNDFVNIFLNATYHPDEHLVFVPKVGVSYLKVRNDQHTTYSGLQVTANTIVQVDEQSKFSGWGPSIGADLDYHLVSGLSVFGNLLYNAIIGDIDSRYQAFQTTVAGNNTDVISKSDSTIVNYIQSEIGLSYLFLPCKTYTGNIMLGWALSKAFGSTQNKAAFTDDVGDSQFASDITNTGYHGPFVRLAFTYDV